MSDCFSMKAYFGQIAGMWIRMGKRNWTEVAAHI